MQVNDKFQIYFLLKMWLKKSVSSRL